MNTGAGRASVSLGQSGQWFTRRRIPQAVATSSDGASTSKMALASFNSMVRQSHYAGTSLELLRRGALSGGDQPAMRSLAQTHPVFRLGLVFNQFRINLDPCLALKAACGLRREGSQGACGAARGEPLRFRRQSWCRPQPLLWVRSRGALTCWSRSRFARRITGRLEG